MMYLTPSASMASSARRVALPALVSSSRVMYLMVLPWTFMPRSSRAIFMPRSRTGPTSEKAPVKDQRPSTGISFAWALSTAGKASPAAAAVAPTFSTSRRVNSLIVSPPRWTGGPGLCSLAAGRIGPSAGRVKRPIGTLPSRVISGVSVVTIPSRSLPPLPLAPGPARREGSTGAGALVRTIGPARPMPASRIVPRPPVALLSRRPEMAVVTRPIHSPRGKEAPMRPIVFGMALVIALGSTGSTVDAQTWSPRGRPALSLEVGRGDERGSGNHMKSESVLQRDAAHQVRRDHRARPRAQRFDAVLRHAPLRRAYQADVHEPAVEPAREQRGGPRSARSGRSAPSSTASPHQTHRGQAVYNCFKVDDIASRERIHQARHRRRSGPSSRAAS